MNAEIRPQLAPISQMRETSILQFPSAKSASSADAFLSLLFTLTVLSICGFCDAAETLVKNVAEFNAAVKQAKPDDVIVLANGEWRDVELVFRGAGTAADPIQLRAETPGRVVLTGTSRLAIGGRRLRVSGLHWKDSTADGDVIAFRLDSKHLAEYCVLDECAISGDRPDRERKWISFYGRNNTVESCRFEGKQSAGTLLVVWLPERDPSSVVADQNCHEICNTFFGPRSRLGKNGGEIIRIGDSKTSEQRSGTFVHTNYFYRCDGEAEIISNKSIGNFYRHNVFVGCSGALTLRHGDDCLVDHNAFFGDGRKGTGGVRVIGAGHQISSNLFHALTGDDTRAALSLMNGIPNSPLNGYFQVQNAVVAKNTFIDCNQSIVIGLADKDQQNQTLVPTECTFSDNAVVSSRRPVFVVRTPAEKMTNADNVYYADELGIESAGWLRTPTTPGFDLAKGKYPVARENGFELMNWELFPKPDSLGPAWLRPGEEFLPEVLKPKRP